MPQWNQSQILLTATIPVALVLCWLVYKRATSDKTTKRKDSVHVEEVDSDHDHTVTNVSPSVNTTDLVQSENEQSDEEVQVAPSSLLDALEDASVTADHTELNFPSNKLSSSPKEELKNICNPVLKQVETVAIDVGEESEPTTQAVIDQHHKDSGDSIQPERADVMFESPHEGFLNSSNIELEQTESMQPVEANIECLGTQENSSSLSSNACCSATESAIQHDEEMSDSNCRLLDISEETKIEESSNTGTEMKEEIITEILSEQSAHINQEENEKCDANKPSSIVSETESDEIETHEEDVENNTDNASNSDQLSTESSLESIAVNSDINANNNNNILDQKTLLVNGEENVEKVITCSNSCIKDNEVCELFEPDIETRTGDHSEVNGWSEEVKHKDDTEKLTEECKEEKVPKKRPNSLPKLDSLDNGVHDTMQVYVEFPSERVGLLIGKQGRNIKQLKQDSGADVFVHAAQYRDDIQVLQICGTQSEVESCVSRIKRRFNDITLSTFDPVNLSVSSPNSSVISPASTPPPMMYPVPSISQLRLPEGIPVEVTVSAIAAVDCVFVQQYTHPSYHGLEALEQAMSLCYAEPSTPCLPNPVQVGLICAAPQQGMWYRAQIIQCFEDSEEILIKFMDYGGYSTLPGKSIKQIRADFVNLPFQAVECYLDNIAPPEDNRFCEETVTKIADMLKEGRFQARVTGYRTDGHSKIHLFKCLNNKVILINQEMATKGLATWIEPAPYQST